MLSKASYRWCRATVIVGFLGTAPPVSAQCTVADIIAQMAAGSEAMELSPGEESNAGAAPVDIAAEDGPAEESAPDENAPKESAPAESAAAESNGNEAPEFVFTPEIQPDQRLLLRQVGQACAWTSDVPNCTFRRVARMALKGRDADFIYDKCSD